MTEATTHAPKAAPTVRPIWHVAVLIALATATLGLYATSMPIPFLFDDALLPWNTQLYTVFGPHTGVIHDVPYPFRGRYVVSFLTAVNVAITGMTPGGLRVGNVLIYVLCGGLLYRVSFRALADARWGRGAFFVAAGATLLWLLHPLNNEAVFYITQRTELLMMLFALATLALAQVSFSSGQARGWQLTAAVTCLLGMMCKENMAAVPLLVLWYDRAWVGESWRVMLRKRGWWYGLLFATVLMPVLTLLGMERSAGVGSEFGVTGWHYLLTQTVVVTWYLTRVVWPTDLWIQHFQPFMSSLSQVWPYALLMVMLLGVSLALMLKRPKVGFVAAVVIFVLAPTSSVIPIIAQPVADRRMLVPLAGLLVLLVLGLWSVLQAVASGLREGTAAWREAAVAFVVIVLVLAGVFSGIGYVHMQRYQTALSAWESIHHRYPQSGIAMTNLAWQYNQRGLHEAALPVARKLTELYPHNANGWGNYAYALDGVGRGDQALAMLEQQIQERPDKWRLHHFQAKLLERRGRDEDARQALWAAYQIEPTASNLKHYTDFLIQRGESDRILLAQWHHQGRDVDTAAQRLRLAKLLLEEGLADQALRQAQAALSFATTDAQRQDAQTIIDAATLMRDETRDDQPPASP